MCQKDAVGEKRKGLQQLEEKLEDISDAHDKVYPVRLTYLTITLTLTLTLNPNP
jgi:hypothetical protein